MTAPLTPTAMRRVAPAAHDPSRVTAAESERLPTQPWRYSYRADPRAVKLANRHYTRQSPGSAQFVPPGRCLVLLTDCADALWVTSWPAAAYVRHAWPGALVCTLFRREPGCPHRASELVAAACAATRAHWPDLPALGMVTFVDPARVRRKRDPGRCFRRAGFRAAGVTAGGLVALRLPPEAFPTALRARPQYAHGQLALFDLAAAS
jgi:hypothetical protein